MSKHTPGPWRIEAEPHRDELICTDRHQIATVLAVSMEDDQAAANARLIAAAPELLVACKSLLIIAINLRDECHDLQLGVDHPAAVELVKRVQNIIAKAQGD
jgi:hypothetical protein